MKKALSAIVDVDIKGNKGLLKKKETIDWDKPHGLRVEFRIDGRVQLNGDGGLLTFALNLLSQRIVYKIVLHS
jgi:DNA topoisomerase-6 subunit B